MPLYSHFLDASLPANWLPYTDTVPTYRNRVSRVGMRGTDHIENTAYSIVVKAWLPRRCLAIEVPLLHACVLREYI
jgi:hypothetical protein